MTNKRFVWGIALFVAAFVNFPIVFINLPRLNRPLVQFDIFLQVAFSLVYALAFIQWIYQTNRTNKKARVQWVGAFALLVVYTVGLTLANHYFIGLPFKTGGTVLIRGILMAVIAYFFSRFMIETERKNEVLLENEQLKHENVLVQLNSLKNQLNPHFLFNSLNTLSWLINDDKAKSQRYLQKLSQVLRFTLTIQEQSLVSLKEEMELVDNYIYLLQMRFGNNLQISTNVVWMKPVKIPPLSIQLLIENAIKHNVISSTSPLKIMIDYQPSLNKITVCNSLNLRPHSEGTGIGLANLNQRFKLLLNQEIEIKQGTEFCVILPLLP